MRSIVLCALVLVGCFDAGIEPEPQQTSSSSTGAGAGDPGLGYEDGERLTAVNYVGDDGSKQFAGWHDNVLDLDCSFVLSPEGYRCMPTVGARLTTNRFYDSACQNLAAFLTAPCEPTPTHVIDFGGACTDFAQRVFNAGPKVDLVYLVSDGDCVEAPPDGFTYYSVAAEMQPSTFVGATRE